MLTGTSERPSSQTILRWRWMVLVVGVAGAVTFEILEPHLGLGSTHMLEIGLYGLVVPGITWVMLTILARQIDRRQRLEHRLARLRTFVQQLVESQSGGRLLDFLVRYPTLVLPAAGSALYGYDHREGRYYLLKAYQADEAGPPVSTLPFCQACPQTAPAPVSRLTQCAAASAGPAHYCLPLAYGGLLLGRLRLTAAQEARLDAENVQFLNALAPEIALGVLMATVQTEEMSAAQTAARHDERRQLSFTLHNSLAQQIGYLHLSLDRLAEQTAAPPAELARGLAELRNVAGDAYEQVRDLLAGLRSPEYHSLGHLLESRLQVFARLTGLETTLQVDGTPRLLSPELNQQIFSLIHEGLNNVQKHAAARRVDLHLTWAAAELEMELADDGRGFDPQPAAAAGHLGLTMLQEQVAELHGTLSILSTAGQGTRLCFCIPLTAAAEPAPATLKA